MLEDECAYSYSVNCSTMSFMTVPLAQRTNYEKTKFLLSISNCHLHRVEPEF